MTASPIAKKKEGTGTFLEPSNPSSDIDDIISPTDLPSKKKTNALVQGQLQAEAVFSLHAGLQAEYL